MYVCVFRERESVQREKEKERERVMESVCRGKEFVLK